MTHADHKRRAAWSAALALALGTAGIAHAAAGATQVVTGTVQPQFGAAVLPDGTLSASGSTIPVDVTRSTSNGIEVLTISPRY